MTTPAAHFSEIVQSRHSVRRFKPTPLAPQDIRGVLEDAQAAPSNCNTQPWTVHVVSGSARDQLSKELIKAEEEGRHSSDFTFDYADFGEGTYLERAHDHAATLYGALGIERADKAGRRGSFWTTSISTVPRTSPSSSYPSSATEYEPPETSACTRRTSSCP